MRIDPKLTSVAADRVLLKDIVREQLRDAIMDGTFAPGETLRDAELLDWLEVSRTPLREAINELARTGLVETNPNRYTRVALRRDDEIAPAMRSLGVLHGGAVLMSLPTLPQSTVDGVLRSCARVAEALRTADADAMPAVFLPLFSQFVDHTPNLLYRERVLDAIDGLVFRAPLDIIVRGLDRRSLAAAAEAAEELEDAVVASDAPGARLAAELLHVRLVSAA